MSKIIPIKELKNTSGISELCHKSNEPIYITKNGYGDMVLLSIELYEELVKKIEMYHDLEISEQQIVEGKTKDAWGSLTAMRGKYGL